MALDYLLKAGKIKSWKPQYAFELKVNGIIIRYRFDFLAMLPDGSQKMIEAKSFATDSSATKRNLFITLYPEIPYEVVNKWSSQGSK